MTPMSHYVNGSHIVALCIGYHGTKEMLRVLAQEFDRFQTWRNNSQQHATTCNMVYKRTQHTTPKNIENCRPTMLRPFANSFILEIVSASVFKVHKVCVTKRPYDSLFKRFNSRQNSSCTSKQPIFVQKDELV